MFVWGKTKLILRWMIESSSSSIPYRRWYNHQNDLIRTVSYDVASSRVLWQDSYHRTPVKNRPQSQHAASFMTALTIFVSSLNWTINLATLSNGRQSVVGDNLFVDLLQLVPVTTIWFSFQETHSLNAKSREPQFEALVLQTMLPWASTFKVVPY